MARDDGGLIPLHNACSFGHAEVVALLLGAGADPNAKDSWSYTPLHEAAVKVILSAIFSSKKVQVNQKKIVKSNSKSNSRNFFLEYFL